MRETVKHTPGPWRVEEGTTLVWGDCNPDDHSTYGMGYPIAETRINPSGNWSTGPYADEGEANARLIATSPEMLEAGSALIRALEQYGFPVSDAATTGLMERGSLEAQQLHAAAVSFRAAIAKAEGKK